MLRILHIDEHLVALDKPAGLLVHRTSLDAQEQVFALQLLRDQLGRPVWPVHRLDKGTSGLLLFALSAEMASRLGMVFEQGLTRKRYMALVRGHWPTGQKQVNAPLLKSNLRSGERMVEVNPEGKEALTMFKVLRRFGDFATLVEARPITGRTHQIRVHALHAGHCIAGDPKYGDEAFTRELRDLGGKRLFLHAYALSVPLPDGNRLDVKAPVDELWAAAVERLANA